MFGPLSGLGFCEARGAGFQRAFALTYLRPKQSSATFFQRWAGSKSNWRPWAIGPEGPGEPPASGSLNRTLMGVGR